MSIDFQVLFIYQGKHSPPSLRLCTFKAVLPHILIKIKAKRKRETGVPELSDTLPSRAKAICANLGTIPLLF